MTIQVIQIGSDADDAWENASGTVAGAAGDDASVGIIGVGGMWGGLRFQGVAAKRYATVDASTTLEVFVINTTNDDFVADVYCEATDNAAAFANTSTNISSRSRTTNKQGVNATSIGALTWYAVTGSGLAAAIQEVLARGGWAPNNALAFIIDALPGIALDLRDYFGNASQAAKLTLVYTDPGEGGANVIAITGGVWITNPNQAVMAIG